MSTSHDEFEFQIQTWLEGLTADESKRHEAVAHAIAKTPTYDERIVAALKQIASSDPKDYARNAAANALQKIAEAHFLAGNDIRAYLEKWRAGGWTRAVPQEPSRTQIPVPPTQPISTPSTPAQPAPEIQAAAFQPLPKPVAPEQIAQANYPITQSPNHPISPSPAPQPPTPAVPFDQWLLSERNIKLALYSGGFLLILAGLIFVGVNWNYLPGIAKLGVTVAVTLSMYVGGAFLYKRPKLKIGGAALLAIASGFLPLNFVVTQIYLTGEMLSNNAMWFIASLACGIVYALTALWSRHNLFTVFAIIAAYSGATAIVWSNSPAAAFAFPYAIVTLVVLLGGIGARNLSRVSFTSRALRISAHLIAPIVFLIAVAEWFLSSTNFYRSNSSLVLVAMFLLVILYVVDDWRSKAVYARWGSSFVFGVFAALVCTELRLSSIQTGLALKILAVVYLLLGKFLQRGKKLETGLPLYLVAALLAAFVTMQSLLVYTRTPGHLALALVGDVALLSIAAYLFRRVEFVYGAAWLALAPVFIYSSVYLQNMTQRGIAFGVMLLVYTLIAFYFAPRHLKWVTPFLSVAAFLSVLVPAMFIPEFWLVTLALVVIAALYAVMAVRLQMPPLLLAAIAAVGLAIGSGARIFYPLNIELARVVAFGLCAWAVILFFARRGLQYLRLNEWAQPLHFGALANFGLTYAFVLFIALDDLWRYGFVSPAFGLTLVWSVALLALTAYLYRRVEFVYAATWLAIAPTYIFARLYFQDAVRVGLVLGALMLVYAAVGFFIGKVRFKWSGAFLSAAVALSVIVVGVLYPNYAVMTAMLVAIGFLYAFFAIWLRWRWLTLAALAALNLALFTGMLSVFTLNIELVRASAIGYAALGVALVAGGVELKRRGWLNWRAPLYLVGAFDLLLALALAAQSNTNALIAVISFVIALVAFAMEWVEREAMQQIKASSTLAYVGAFAALLGIFSTLRALNLPIEYAPTAIALGSALYIGGALLLRRAQQDVPTERLYGNPLRYVGWFGMGCALLASLVLNKPLAGAFTFGIAAIAFAADGFVRKQIAFVYASGAAVVATIWYVLFYLRVTEWQAFAIPLGAWCLAVGWSEGLRGRVVWFRLATLTGFAILFGSAFYQSLSNINYALLLLVESAIAFGIGWRLKSRVYVSAAILALAANGLAQFGPAFVNLDRWIQIGTIGSILLLGGLIGLLRREKILDARRSFTSEWKAWRP